MKTVLDVCCGSKMFYFDKNNPLVDFCDIRFDEKHKLCDGRTLIINPDMVCDFRSLPFADERYNVVVFDPPHLVNAGDSSWIAKKYGKLDKSWKDDIRKGFSECFRVLKQGGVLIFKWSEDQINCNVVLELAPQPPLLGDMRGKRRFIIFVKE